MNGQPGEQRRIIPVSSGADGRPQATGLPRPRHEVRVIEVENGDGDTDLQERLAPLMAEGFVVAAVVQGYGQPDAVRGNCPPFLILTRVDGVDLVPV